MWKGSSATGAIELMAWQRRRSRRVEAPSRYRFRVPVSVSVSTRADACCGTINGRAGPASAGACIALAKQACAHDMHGLPSFGA